MNGAEVCPKGLEPAHAIERVWLKMLKPDKPGALPVHWSSTRRRATRCHCSPLTTSSSMAAIRITAMTCSRAADWKAGGIHYLDAHTTGGVASLDRSCCLIIGGEADTVAHLRPVFFRPRLLKVGNAGQKP